MTTADQIMAEVFDVVGEPASSDEMLALGGMASIPMGRRMARERLAGEFLYASGIGWLRWDGRRWARLHPSDPAVEAAAADWAVADITRMIKDNAPDEVVKKALRYREVGNVRQLVDASRMADGMAVPAARLDTHPHLLNTPSGVVDLSDGSLAAHDPGLRITKLTRASYVAGLTSPDWEQALQALTDDAREYLQNMLGQALWGEKPPNDELAICKGDGANGKNTVVGGVHYAFGDYSVVVPHKVLLGNPNDHTTEWMTLRGARLGWVNELPEGRRLESSLLKRLTEDQITARYIRQDSVTFDNTATVVVSTNYPVVVDETDPGTWRRLAVVEFPFRFVSGDTPPTGDTRPGDPTLRPRILNRADGPGQRAALAWAVEGAVRYHRAGHVLPPQPAGVRDATMAMRRDTDVLLAYIDEHLAFDPEACVLSQELYQDFTAWLAGRGRRTWNDQTFAQRLAQHSVVAERGVKKTRDRGVQGLSRSGRWPGMTVPQRPAVWAGLRWRDAR